ncbi:MAG: phage integrase N-terminal SAM-like domain-containing protein, partial [Actinomycetota bacterium]|nr:phage integrase N-terminal SAM-like domain-containing protein [Actinomycetota bacterium]
MAERLDDLAKSWARDLRAADKADRTIIIYGQSVKFFADWLAGQGRPQTVDSLTKHAVSAWLGDLYERCQGATVLTRYKGLRRFCRWLVAEGELTADPMAGLEQPKPRNKPVPVISDDEVARLFKVTAGPDFADRRDNA